MGKIDPQFKRIAVNVPRYIEYGFTELKKVQGLDVDQPPEVYVDVVLSELPLGMILKVGDGPWQFVSADEGEVPRYLKRLEEQGPWGSLDDAKKHVLRELDSQVYSAAEVGLLHAIIDDLLPEQV